MNLCHSCTGLLNNVVIDCDETFLCFGSGYCGYLLLVTVTLCRAIRVSSNQTKTAISSRTVIVMSSDIKGGSVRKVFDCLVTSAHLSTGPA